MHCSWYTLVSLLIVLSVVALGTAAQPEPSNDARAKRFIAGYETDIRPQEIAVSRLWWKANISGKDEDFQAKEEAETRLDVRLSDPQAFAELKAIRGQPIRDPLVARQIRVLELEYLPKQLDRDLLKQMNVLANKVEKTFNVYRAKVDGKQLTENQVRDVLRHSKDSAQRRATWEASKAVGGIIDPDLKALARLRNRAARKLGFRNYHVMALVLNEQTQEQVLALFDALDALTRGPFHAAKGEIDQLLARNCGVTVDELRPWHYHDPFFQESPDVFGGQYDQVYAKIDILDACRRFYGGIGLPIEDVIARSDLYEKPGKSPHAFCTDIDREGDVRVLGNVVRDKNWLATMLHELGHSVYSSKNIPRSVPWILRGESHILTTEGVAMMFERLAGSSAWLQAMGCAVPDPQAFDAASRKLQRNQLLIFSRWCQVMFRFEIALYDDPEQDLGRVWWDLVEKYQELKRPEGRTTPDYASKIHIVGAPAYYHNYMLGQLFASQVHRTIAREVLHVPAMQAVYVGHPAVGDYMKHRVFEPGRTLDWNQLTRYATGEDLNPKAFAADFRDE